MKKLLILLACVPASIASADVLYSQQATLGNTFYQSSWLIDQGSDWDMYAYDNFTIPVTADVTHVEWQGGYIYNGQWGRASDFSIFFYATKATVNEPDCGNPQLPEWYLARYLVGSNAVETLHPGTSNVYDYSFDLPTAFHAVGGTQYWIRILAWQPSVPDWGLNSATGGDGHYFNFSTGAAMFSWRSGDTASLSQVILFRSPRRSRRSPSLGLDGYFAEEGGSTDGLRRRVPIVCVSSGPHP